MFSKSDRLLVLAAHLGSISVGFFAVHGVMEQAKAPLGSPVYSKDGPSPTHFSILRIPSPASHPQAGVLPKRSLGFRPAKAIPRPPHTTRKHTIRPTPLRIRPPSAAPPWATAAGLTGPVP